MNKDTFEYFMYEKHAEQYIGTKDCMVDDESDWLCDLDIEDWFKYGELYAIQQKEELIKRLEKANG